MKQDAEENNKAWQDCWFKKFDVCMLQIYFNKIKIKSLVK